MGHGDATVILRSNYGNITIIAEESDEREYSMSNESNADNKEQEKEGPRTWEGGFGKHRFRAQWDRGPKHARFHFQGPFTDDDPDGIGTEFSPDFGFEWERGRGARVFGEYEERWDDVREQAERAARRTAERAKRYAQRATRHVRDTDWDAVEHEVQKVVEKVMSELEETLATIRHEWKKYDEAEVPLDENTADSAPSASSRSAAPSSPLSRDERDVERRVILEELRTGNISVEEAERRLNSLD